MKRVLGFVLVFLLSLTGVLAAVYAPYANTNDPIPFTCEEFGTSIFAGESPDSDAGRGAVDICNYCYPCGRADGVCPADFSSGTAASCAAAPDPDCSGCITLNLDIDYGDGNVQPLPSGEVEIEVVYNDPYSEYNFEETMDIVNGQVTGINVMSGVTFWVYVTFLDEVSGTSYAGGQPVNGDLVTRGEGCLFLDNPITLEVAQCNSDCTRGNSPVCDPTCFNECMPDFGEYTQELVQGIMEDNAPVVQGEELVLNTAVDEDICIQTQDVYLACEGPVEQQDSYLITGPVCSTLDFDDSISNLVTRVHRVWYNQGQFSQPVELVIMTWDEEN